MSRPAGIQVETAGKRVRRLARRRQLLALAGVLLALWGAYRLGGFLVQVWPGSWWIARQGAVEVWAGGRSWPALVVRREQAVESPVTGRLRWHAPPGTLIAAGAQVASVEPWEPAIGEATGPASVRAQATPLLAPVPGVVAAGADGLEALLTPEHLLEEPPAFQALMQAARGRQQARGPEVSAPPQPDRGAPQAGAGATLVQAGAAAFRLVDPTGVHLLVQVESPADRPKRGRSVWVRLQAQGEGDSGSGLVGRIAAALWPARRPGGKEAEAAGGEPAPPPVVDSEALARGDPAAGEPWPALVVEVFEEPSGSATLLVRLERYHPSLAALRVVEAAVVTRRTQGVVVPVRALVARQGRTGVWVRSGGGRVFVPVRVLASDGEFVAVDGLPPGSSVSRRPKGGGPAEAW